tara:strand:+ start:8216 stop:8638 length:423 start_codon:yes stop_codon:yes gene_type:complete
MIKFLSRLEDKLLDYLIRVLPKPKKKDNTITLHAFFLGLTAMQLLAVTVAAGTVASVVQRRKARKMQEAMRRKARLQQARQNAEMLKAEKQSRTPPAPKAQQLAVQAKPDTAVSSLGNRSALSGRGKSKLRIGGKTGTRY